MLPCLGFELNFSMATSEEARPTFKDTSPQRSPGVDSMWQADAKKKYGESSLVEIVAFGSAAPWLCSAAAALSL
jgi:hypothetical protein